MRNDWPTLMAGDYRNICVVGDTDQSINEWRDARPSIMLDFPSDWPGCRVVGIDINHRSTRKILDPASSVVAPQRAADRPVKRLCGTRFGAPVALHRNGYGSPSAEASRPTDMRALCRGTVTRRAFQGVSSAAASMSAAVPLSAIGVS